MKRFGFPGEAKTSEKNIEIRKLMHLLFGVTRHGVDIKSNPDSCCVRLVEEGKIYSAGRLNTACGRFLFRKNIVRSVSLTYSLPEYFAWNA